MTTDRESSPAWHALSKASRRMLIVIEHAIAERGGREAELSYSYFLDAPPELAISRPVIRPCVRRLEAVGFIRVRLGQRRINVFALSDDWRAIDKAGAKRRLARAKATKPRPAPKQLRLGEASPRSLPKEPPRRAPTPQPLFEPTERQQPSLPKLRFMGEI